MTELLSLTIEIKTMLAQYSQFIQEFYYIVATNDVNVITDASGTLSIEGPSTILDKDLENIGKRVRILDGIIIQRGEQVQSLILRAVELENTLKSQDPSYTSQLVDKIKEFDRIKSSYNHY